MTRTRSFWARRASYSHPRPPFPSSMSRRHSRRGPCSMRPLRCSRGGAATRRGPVWTAQTAEWQPRPRPAGTSPRTPQNSGRTSWRTAQRWRPQWLPGPVAARPAHLLPCVPCQGARPRLPAATHAPTAPLKAEKLHAVDAALLADGGESFFHHHGPTQLTGSIQGPQRDAPHPWRATLRERTLIRDADCRMPQPPGPSKEKRWSCRRRATRLSCMITPGATARTS